MPYDIVEVVKAARQRRKRVLAWRAAGKNFEEIAKLLGVTRQRAYSIHHEAVKEAERLQAETGK